MFQDTSETYLYQTEAVTTSRIIGQYGAHVTTPNSQGTESETSFDSGYRSPISSQNTSRNFLPKVTNDQYMLNGNSLTHQSSHTNSDQKLLFDDEWDKKFIENFETNLFGIDPSEDFSSEDINLFSELLSSPLKTSRSPVRLYDRNGSPAKYARSPYKTLFSPPKPLNSRRSLGGVGLGWPDYRSVLPDQTSLNILPSDKDQIHLVSLSNNPNFTFNHDVKLVKSSCMLDESLSTHNYAKPHFSTNLESRNDSQQRHIVIGSMIKYPEIQPAPVIKSEPNYTDSNLSPELLPSKQKLQYARAKFRQTLEKAVENANIAAINEEKYPQLTKRLSKSNSASQLTKLKENVPSFTQTSDVHKSSKSDFNSSLSTTNSHDANNASKQRFRELAPAPSQKRTFACIVNNQFEVQQPSDCQIVIKKRRTY